jgi:hypothetical protein
MFYVRVRDSGRGAPGSGPTNLGTPTRDSASIRPDERFDERMVIAIADLQAFAGRRVRIRLDDASEMVGELRTELLSEKSISVFLKRSDVEGATIYIEEIVGIWPIS